MTLNGTGFGTLPQGGVSGLLAAARGTLNFTGAGSWSGNILLNTSNVAIGTSGGAGTVTGIISGTASLTKVNANGLTLSAADTFTGSLTISGGTVTLGNANTYGGTTTIGTTANLTVSNFGTIPSTTSVTAYTGGTLLLDNSTTLLTNRLGDSTGIALNGATFQFNANNNIGMATSQSVGIITLAGGQSTINTGFTGTAVSGATSVLTSAGLVRNAGATVNFVGGANFSPLGTSNNQLLFGNLLTTNGTVGAFNSGLQYQGNQGNILPYAEVNGLANVGDFATYTTSGIATFSSYVQLFLVGNTTLNANPGDIVKINAFGSSAYTLTAASGLSVGALLFDNVTAAAITISVPNTLTVASGLLMFQGTGAAADTIVGGQVNLGSEGIIFNNNAGTLSTNINTVVSGSSGLTLGGTGGTLVLPAANSITGNTTINAGTITLGSAASIGSGSLTFGGSANVAAGAITLSGTQALSFGAGQAVTLNNVNLTLAGTTPITFAGTTTLVGISTLTITDTGGVYFTGQITDGGTGGGLVLGGTGTVFLTNSTATANSFSGGVLLAGTATVVVSDANALGSGTIGFAGTTAVSQLVANAPINFPNPYVVNGGVMAIGGTSSLNNVTFSGVGTLTASATLTDNDLGTLTLSGSLGEAGGGRSLTINGPGTLALTPIGGAINTYSRRHHREHERRRRLVRHGDREYGEHDQSDEHQSAQQQLLRQRHLDAGRRRAQRQQRGQLQQLPGLHGGCRQRGGLHGHEFRLQPVDCRVGHAGGRRQPHHAVAQHQRDLQRYLHRGRHGRVDLVGRANGLGKHDDQSQRQWQPGTDRTDFAARVYDGFDGDHKWRLAGPERHGEPCCTARNLGGDDQPGGRPDAGQQRHQSDSGGSWQPDQPPAFHGAHHAGLQRRHLDL